MDDLYRAFDDRASVILDELDATQLGSARRRHRVDRPRSAHDVAPHRPARTRCTTRPCAAKCGDAIERIYRALRPVRRAKSCERLEPGTLRLRLSDHGFHSLRHGREPQHLAGAERLSSPGRASGRQEPERPVRRRPAVLGARRLDHGPAPTRSGSGKSTSTCGAARGRASSAPAPRYTPLADELSTRLAHHDRPDDRPADCAVGLQAR